jgi:protein gp37
MADKTGIEWTDATWNPVVGCSVISPGCTNCYAMRMAARLEKMGRAIYRGMTTPGKAGPVWSGRVEASNWGQMIKPMTWRRPRRIFVNSMSDLFHENLADDVIDQVFAVMALCPQHTFQVLTKRPARMRAYVTGRWSALTMGDLRNLAERHGLPARTIDQMDGMRHPLPNVWLGISIENQVEADRRTNDLRAIPAAKRFLSMEPLLEQVRPYLQGIDWVIVGGESGPGARPMHPDWARKLRDQCAASGVPFFFKQNGEFYPVDIAYADLMNPTPERNGELIAAPNGILVQHPKAAGTPVTVMRRVGKKRAGNLLDGRQHQEFPA